MKSSRDGINRVWIARGIFALLLTAVACAYAVTAVWKPAPAPVWKPAPAQMTDLEERHWKLALATEADLAPDFSRSVSEPLKQWPPHRTDGVVQPLWPWLAACIGSLTSENQEGAVHGARWFQLGLTLAFLLALGLACGRRFSLPAALLVMLLIGFDGLLPAVGLFTGAALFQVLFLLTWVICVYGMQRNSLWVYGLAGAVGALSYLADERALPLLAVFLFVSSLRAVWEWLAGHFPRQFGAATTLWHPRNHLLGTLLMAALFFFITGPRLAESHDRFGSAFFHYQDQVRWLDDAEAARAWRAEHPDADRLARARGEESPSWRRFRQTHSGEEMRARLGRGIRQVLSAFSAERGAFVCALLLLLLVMAAAMPLATAKATHAGQRLHPETVPAVLFVVLSAAAYLLIAGWDAAVTGAEDRLLPLHPPLVLALLWACESLRRRACRRQASPVFSRGYQALLWVMVALQSWRVIQGLQAPPAAL